MHCDTGAQAASLYAAIEAASKANQELTSSLKVRHTMQSDGDHDRPSVVEGDDEDDGDGDDGESDVEGGGDVEAGLQSASSTVSAEGSETGLPPRKNSRIKRARKAAAEKARRTAEEQSGSRPSSRAGTPVDGGPASPFSRVVNKGEEAAAAEAAEAAAAEAEAAAEAAADAYALAASGGMGGAAETPAIPSLDALVESQEAGLRSPMALEHTADHSLTILSPH